MPSKSLGLFPASLSTDPLFCLEFVEITNKIETAGDLKARERNGMAVGKDKYILFCVLFAANVALRARSRVLALSLWIGRSKWWNRWNVFLYASSWYLFLGEDSFRIGCCCRYHQTSFGTQWYCVVLTSPGKLLWQFLASEPKAQRKICLFKMP